MDALPRFVRSVLEFQCLADRCEDTCCVGLRIPVSEERLAKLREGVAGTPDAERVAMLVVPQPDGPPAERAFIQMGSDGSCPFLDTQKFCSLHRRHGERVLPDGCATFPRIVSKVGEQVEVAGSLACPEMARRLLLKADALEQVPGPWEQVPRPEVARPFPGEPGDAYVLHAERIRAAALVLLHQQGFPLASRLGFLGQWAFQLDSIFRGEAPFAGDAEQAGQVLDALLPPFEAPDKLEAMHRDFATLEVPGGPCAGLLASMLKARRAVARGERFKPFADGVLVSLWGSEEAEGSPEEAWREVAARWDWLDAVHGARIQQYFLHYTVNQWLRAPFTEAPSLLAYVFRLAVRVAMLRLALAGHPAVAALRASASGLASEEQQALLDRAAVECFYLVARHVEQAPDILSLVWNMAGAGGAETLGKLILFSKF
ncbi:flagellin lysine-N-methylase [Stigmatella sp. ncwal1]|uniref:Flagellin lysine-N-methylase n=1 Tax=Stigmatella ashevillensis TaxID=2995309 RepID=A0ABT5DAB7_9BACT|nr:flagellin lysine-N-methylase [Stigmatella ashevillena]MDC0710496.1 flagellin lysine-N-methylase [Stigmatella ashevillena]